MDLPRSAAEGREWRSRQDMADRNQREGSMWVDAPPMRPTMHINVLGSGIPTGL